MCKFLPVSSLVCGAFCLLVAIVLVESIPQKYGGFFAEDSCSDLSSNADLRFFKTCNSCCKHKGKSAWESDEEATQVAQGKCMCKRKTHEESRCHGTESCQACCPKDEWSNYNFNFEMDKELSYKDGKDCVCRVKFFD